MAPLVQIRNLSKSYGGVRALANLSLDLEAGEIHALCGENGAGKSTLIKCLCGATTPDAGQVTLATRSLSPGDVQDAEAAGVAVLHQESTAFPDLDVCDNIFVGRELAATWIGWSLRTRMEREATAILATLGQSLPLRRPVRELSIAQRQMVSLARALSQKCRLLIMDEPTASLSSREIKTLLHLARQLQQDGVTILFVSHRLEEVFELANRVTVLRDGKWVSTRRVEQIGRTDLIRDMVGRDVITHTSQPSAAFDPQQKRLEVRGLNRPPAFRDVHMTIYAGEVVGLAGLVGAGRSEVARAVFGIDAYVSGQVIVGDSRLPPNNIRAAIRAGLGLVPEDRQHQGLALPMTIRENVTMAILRRLCSRFQINTTREKTVVANTMQQLDIKAPSGEVPTRALSGGNQQKVVLGKWLAANPRVLILDEPTRGVDVAAKNEVHAMIRQLADDGLAALVISSELPELLAVCDRIVVMCEGRVTGELDARSTTQEEILNLALSRDP